MSDTTPERKANDGVAAEAANAEAVNTGAVNTEAVNTDAFDNAAFSDEASESTSEAEAAAAEPARTAQTNDEAIELAYEPEPEPEPAARVASEHAAAPAVDFSAAPAAASALSATPDAVSPASEAVPVDAAPVSVVPVSAVPAEVAAPAVETAPEAATQAYATPIDYAAAETPAVESVPAATVTPAVATVAATAAAASAAPGALYDPNTAAPVGQYVPAPQPIFVQAPTPPTNKGNRGVGILIGLLATVVFALLYAGCTYLVSLSQNPSIEKASESFSLFVTNAVFYVPVLFFFGAFALLVAIVNRGGWWAYVLGAFAVAVIVYFSYIGGALLTVRAWEMTPSQAGQFVASQWLNPVAIIAAIAAREVPIWFGAWIAARGRKVTERNVVARQEYDRVLAEGPSVTRL